MVLLLEHQTWVGLSNYSQGLEYIVHYIVGLAHFYNKYVKLIWYYHRTLDLGWLVKLFARLRVHCTFHCWPGLLLQ